MLFLFMSSKYFPIYLIALLEGGALLSFEIMISRIYTPHLGSTIFVWTSILTCTLISLALAYHFSHRLIIKSQWKALPVFLTCAGLYILFSTYASQPLLEATYTMPIKTASLVIGFLIVSVPVFCMGVVSPMLATYISETTQNIGKETGIIYGLSTLSGVVLTLMSVFILMPNVGVRNSLLIISIFLFVAALISYFKTNKK